MFKTPFPRDRAAAGATPANDAEVELVRRSAADALASAEIRGLVTHALQRLSHEHRAVLSLTYYNSLGCREIAAIMGCPVDTVKTRMFHARRRLRALLAGAREDWL